MDLRVGVIGTGAIGRQHIERLSKKMTGVKVTAVNDIVAEAAQKIAEQCGASYYSDPQELINSDQVDAVLIASSDATHAKFVLMAIEAEKPVFCEKPLATNADDARKIVEAEVALGKKLVQVGFMRRYDVGYLEMKDAIDEGRIGAPLMLHCAHRNPTPGPGHTTEMSITNSVIHEIDLLRWLIGDDYKSAQVIVPRSSSLSDDMGIRDPQIILLETKSGIRIDVESFVNCQYGYDIKCEVVGETGTVSLPEPAKAIFRSKEALSRTILNDWSLRFIEAYETEIAAWVESTKRDAVEGPTAWDGYLASVTSDACVEALKTGKIVDISTPFERPALYV